jgi:preprotein translocase subunit SecG
MACECSMQGAGAGAGMSGSVTSTDQGYIPGDGEIPSRFCFSCTTFWIIIAIVFLFLLAGSGRRG